MMRQMGRRFAGRSAFDFSDDSASFNHAESQKSLMAFGLQKSAGKMPALQGAANEHKF